MANDRNPIALNTLSPLSSLDPREQLYRARRLLYAEELRKLPDKWLRGLLKPPPACARIILVGVRDLPPGFFGVKTHPDEQPYRVDPSPERASSELPEVPGGDSGAPAERLRFFEKSPRILEVLGADGIRASVFLHLLFFS